MFRSIGIRTSEATAPYSDVSMITPPFTVHKNETVQVSKHMYLCFYIRGRRIDKNGLIIEHTGTKSVKKEIGV